jgi:hypothetical protein
MQIFILNIEEADSPYALTRSATVLDTVNWISLTLKKIKAGTVKKCLCKIWFGEGYVTDNLVKVS